LDISRALKSIRKNIKTSAKSYLNHYEWEQNKPRIDKECLKSLSQRK
jgi:chorismate mutase